MSEPETVIQKTIKIPLSELEVIHKHATNERRPFITMAGILITEALAARRKLEEGATQAS